MSGDGEARSSLVELRPIDDANLDALLSLRVSPTQQRFVSDVAESLAEAAEEPGGRAIQWAVYAGAEPVGFVMISDEVEGPGYIAQYLWKLLIDHRYQRRGYGAAALDRVVEYFRSRPGRELMWTSAGQGPGSPISFYEHYGFERTGDIVFDDEVLLRLRLT